MKKRFTILIAAIAAILMMTQPVKVMGQEKGFTAYYTLECSSQSGNSAYASYYDVNVTSAGSITMTWNAPGNQTLGSYWRIGGGKGSNVKRYITGKTAMGHSISKIELNHNGISNSNLTINSIAITIATDSDFANNHIVETRTINSPSVSSSGTLTFSPNDVTVWNKDCYYKITIDYSHNKDKNYGLDITSVVFYKTTYTITYNANEATGGTAPSATVADAGSNATVASNTGSLVKTGFNFSGWNTANDGSGANYAEGATINSIAQDYTLYAKWTSASSPNIVVSGSGISSNALNLAYTATENQTATASFNNMTGYSSPTVTLYDNLACTESFSGNWFSASLSGSTITYNASANASAARTVYMRVSAVYNETTYYSNVITVTQAALPCTVTYDKNNSGASGTMSDSNSPYAYGSTVTVLANGFTAPTGKVFYKWNTESDGTGTYYVKDNTFDITESTTLYAIWHDLPTYTMITSVSQIIPGAHYVVVGSNASTPYTYKYMGAQNGSYRNAVDVTVYSKDTDDDGEDDTYYLQQAGLYEFVISGYTDNYTIYDETNETKGYLYHVGDKNVSVRASIGNDDAAKWKLSFDDDDAIVINNAGATNYYLQYNSGSPRFTEYTSSSKQRDGYLFIKDNDADCNIYSATTLSKNESYTNLTIVKNTNVNGSITVPNAKTLTVTNTLTNQGTAANLVIEDGGQLILANDNSVAATVKKTVNKPTETWGNNDASGWYAISSPVGDIAPESVTNMTLDPVNNVPQYDLYKYVENMGWYNSQHSGQSISTLEKGHGYLYALNANKTLSFTGSVVSGDFDIENLSYTDAVAHSGLHLIGNPYTHTIYYGVAIDGDISDAGYYKLNSTGSWISTAAGTAINPMEAVFVFVTKDDATVNFINDASAPALRANHDYIKFAVSNSQYEDVAYAMFDKGNGLSKIEHRNSEAPMIYIPQDDNNYAIAMMEDNTQMFGLNFKAATTSRYTLSFDTKGEYNYLHVIDRFTGTDTDMLLEGEYNFIGSPIDNDNRFVVKLAYKPDYSEGNDEIFAFQNGSDIFVSGEGELQVFDVTGRFVMSERINGATSISADALSKGVYVLRIVGSEIKTQKIVVR